MRRTQPCSFQLRVVFLGLLQNGNVGIGVFPKGEEVSILGASLASVAGENVGAGDAEMGERTEREVDHDAAVVEKPLEFCGCGTAVVGQYLGLAPDVSG